MPSKPNRPCAVPGCPRVALAGKARCEEHESQRQRQSDAQRPSAAARGYDAKWRVIRAQFLKAHPICSEPECGKPSSEPHHIVPLSAGGTNHWDNLRALCKSCHSAITRRMTG